MKQIDVTPFLKSMESELRDCDGKRALEILDALTRWAADTSIKDDCRKGAERLQGRARFRFALATANNNAPTARQQAVLNRLRTSRPVPAAG